VQNLLNSQLLVNNSLVETTQTRIILASYEGYSNEMHLRIVLGQQIEDVKSSPCICWGRHPIDTSADGSPHIIGRDDEMKQYLIEQYLI
jgi:hypothetical protein